MKFLFFDSDYSLSAGKTNLLSVLQEWCMMLISVIIGDANLDHLLKLVPPKYLHYKIIVFLHNMILEHSLQLLYKYSTPHKAFQPLISVFIILLDSVISNDYYKMWYSNFITIFIFICCRFSYKKGSLSYIYLSSIYLSIIYLYLYVSISFIIYLVLWIHEFF